MSQQPSKLTMQWRIICLVLSMLCMSAANSDELGQSVYDKYCTPCHGENGDANTAASRALNPMPRNFTQADFVNDLTRKSVIETVTKGRPGTAMVGWQKRLSGEQIEAVADYVRQRFAAKEISLDCASCHGEESDHSLGKQVYQSRCYFCHGYDGYANTEAAQYLDPPPKNLREIKLSQAQLATVIGSGREGTAMMPFATVISQREIAAVAAYVKTTFSDNVSGKVETYHSKSNGWSISYDPSMLDAAKPKACLSCHEAKPLKPELVQPKLVWRNDAVSDSD